MAITVSQSTGTFGSAPKGINNNLYRVADPTKYTSLYDFIDEVNAPDVRAQLSKTFGNQGISGFLSMTGAIKNNGNADEVTYWEEARLHQVQSCVNNGAIDVSSDDTPTISLDGVKKITESGYDDTADKQVIARPGDILLLSGVDRILVTATTGTSITAKPLTALTKDVADNAALDLPIVGNMFAQGTDQPGEFIESNVVKRTNPYAIVKETYEVSGSQATNLGYIDLGGGDYRYYIKSEGDTRQRFMDKREMTMLLGQKASNISDIDGTEGYFAAVEDRGMVTSDYIDELAEMDTLIKEMDKNGCPAEYAVYSATTQDLNFDDMIADVNAGGGLSASYGAFNNDRDMALNLGFKSFSRGGYTFHKNSFKLLNDPTLLGSNDVHVNLAAGVMIPLANVVDPKTGDKSPALEMNYKSEGAYSREMEHWVEGGGVLGFKTDGKDRAKFNYRSECCLVTRAANQHVLIQGA